MKRQQVASFNVALDPLQSSSSPQKMSLSSGALLESSTSSSSSALAFASDGSSAAKGSKGLSLHRRKEKKRKEKKKKKKGPSPHKDKGERGKGREITGPHLSKEVSSWSRKSSMSSPRSWAPRAESWVSRWR